MFEALSARALAAGALVLSTVACGPKQDTAKPTPDLPEPVSEAPELPAVPVDIDTKMVEPPTGDAPGAAAPLLATMAAENARWSDALAARKEYPAFYISYQIHDLHSVSFAADRGSLVDASDDRARNLDVDLRVGTPHIDNRHPLRNDRLAVLSNRPRFAQMPFGDDEQAIETHLWLETDRRYREAVLQFNRVETAKSVGDARSDMPPDFSREKAVEFIQTPMTLTIDKARWAERARLCSHALDRGVATRAVCQIDFDEHVVYFVNSEGSKIQMAWTTARLTVSVGVKTPDGMGLSRIETAYASTPEELPDDAELERMIALVTKDLTALHEAPVVAPYTGPAILRGRAAGVFFHEVFGHRVEGHRQKLETSGQTFSTKLGERIMPAWLSVYDDPRLARLNGVQLNGFYHYDDEGVPAQRANLVDNGVLKGFVMGRNPLDGFPDSNGHGRHQPGLLPVSRQGNLVVEAARSVPDAELKKMLIAEIKRQNKPYGMMFTEISGGFTNTERFLPQSFKVEPVMAYRVYPDGREELVRGVDIEGTPLIALGSIAAAGRTVEVFNGMCGAESGWVPVSASAPSLLLTQLEVARTMTGSDASPTLPPPSVHGGVR